MYRTTDGGKTWERRAILADNHPGASDRPWIDVYPKRSNKPWDTNRTTVYLEYHTFTPDDLVYVTKSVDGGATFGPPILATIGTNALPDSGCNTVPGGVTVDQNTGTVYVVWLSGNDVVSNLETGCNYSQIGPFDKAWVSTSTDGGLTWRAHLAWQGTFDPVTKIGDNADKIFGTMTVDTSGQVHVVLAVRHNDDPVGFVADCETNPQCREDPQTTDLLLATSPDLQHTAPERPFERLEDLLLGCHRRRSQVGRVRRQVCPAPTGSLGAARSQPRAPGRDLHVRDLLRGRPERGPEPGRFHRGGDRPGRGSERGLDEQCLRQRAG